MEVTSLGKHKKRLWCLVDARRVAVEAGDVSCPTPLINRRKDPPVVVHRGRRDRMVLRGRRRAGRRGRRDRRDHQGRRGFMVVGRRGLRDRLVLPVRGRRGRREGDLRAPQDNRNLGRPLDGYAHGAVVIRVSVLAGITRSR